MGLTAMLVGSISGTGMQMMNNALQKVPLSRSKCLENNNYSVFVFGRTGGVLGFCFIPSECLKANNVIQGGMLTLG